MIVGAFVVAAVVTPPDMVSQLLLAIPMCLLYEFGIILAQLMQRFLGKYASETEGVPDTVGGAPDQAESQRKLPQ